MYHDLAIAMAHLSLHDSIRYGGCQAPANEPIHYKHICCSVKIDEYMWIPGGPAETLPVVALTARTHRGWQQGSTQAAGNSEVPSIQ